jgi:hypothetical protein
MSIESAEISLEKIKQQKTATIQKRGFEETDSVMIQLHPQG